jgi:putative PEP-CTERM system TPR-repeat lipoprotein
MAACSGNQPDALIKRAKADLAAGDSPAAIIELRAALAKDSHVAEAWLLLCDAALLQNDRGTAEDSVEKARANGAPPAELAAREWVLLRLKGNYSDLKRAVEKAGDSVPEALRARFLGEALMALRQPGDALVQYQRAAALAPGNVDAVVGLASAEVATNQSDAGIKTLKDAMAADPKEARFPLALAEVYSNAGRSQEALDLYKSAVSLTSVTADSPTWIVAEAGLAQSALALGQYAQVHDAINALSKGAPHLLVTKLLQARVALAEGHPAEAASYAQAVTVSLPTDVQGHMLLAYAMFQQGYTQQAETSLDTVLTDHPEYTPARKLLAEIQLSTKRLDEAKHTLDSILGQDADPDTLVLAGRVAQSLGQMGASDTYFNRALTSPAVTDDLKYRIALIYMRAGKRDAADEILKTLPGGSELAKKRDLLLALSKVDGAKDGNAALDAVAKQYAGDLTMQRTVAQLHASRGDVDTARSQLNALLHDHPDDIDTMLTLANVEGAAKHPDVAEALLHASMSLARIALERGDMDAVVKNLEAARAADPKALEPRLSLARLYLARLEKTPSGTITPEALESARIPLKEALTIAPHQVDVVLLSAQLEAIGGHVEDAKNLLRGAATNDAASAPLWLEMATLQVRSKETSKAYESLNHALTVRAGWLPAVRMLAALNVSEGSYDHALDVARKAREVQGQIGREADTQRAAALFLEGEVLSAEANKNPANAAKLWVQAASIFAQSYTTQPSAQAAVRIMQVRRFAKLPDPESTLVAWIAQHPSDGRSRSALATFYGESGNRAKQIETYESAVKVGNATPDMLNNLAWVYSENHDQRALPTAEQALQQAGRKPEILDTVGWILVQQGKFADAKPYLLEAQKGNQRNPDIAYHLAFTLAKTGEVDAAKKLVGEVLLTPGAFGSRAAAESLAATLK